eukprot:GHVR01031331.1.p1 GENE.GHVR01031331.1~~GHVR01031331.1.p1  ORF type:complete len:186 (+),score=20.82 GHVR01031331.1:417-974(+)
MEAAQLCGLPSSSIERHVNEGVVSKVVQKGSFTKRGSAYVPIHTVAYACTIERTGTLQVDLNDRMRLFTQIEEFGIQMGVAEPSPGVRISVDSLAGQEWEKACEYVAARGKYLDDQSPALDGSPVIKGTQLSCTKALERISAGETVDDLRVGYERIPRCAFEAALIFAAAHVEGRPTEAGLQNPL